MAKKGRIFLLDDDELISSMLARTLEKDGYDTHQLNSSENAVKQICAWQPHALLLDVDLGEGLGDDRQAPALGAAKGIAQA